MTIQWSIANRKANRNCFHAICLPFRRQLGRVWTLKPTHHVSVTNRHPEMPFFQKQQLRKIKSIQVSAQDVFFHLIRGLKMHPIVATYLIKEHPDVKERHLSILKSWSPCTTCLFFQTCCFSLPSPPPSLSCPRSRRWASGTLSGGGATRDPPCPDPRQARRLYRWCSHNVSFFSPCTLRQRGSVDRHKNGGGGGEGMGSFRRRVDICSPQCSVQRVNVFPGRFI